MPCHFGRFIVVLIFAFGLATWAGVHTLGVSGREPVRQGNKEQTDRKDSPLPPSAIALFGRVAPSHNYYISVNFLPDGQTLATT